MRHGVKNKKLGVNAEHKRAILRALTTSIIGKGMEADYADILKNVQERDYIDSHREVSPLRQADDAILLDNSNMTIPEQKEWLLERFKEATR